MSHVHPNTPSRLSGGVPLQSSPGWTFLSNYAHVLLVIAGDPEIKLRDIAWRVGITERAVQRIVADLEASAYLERERTGRRNHYRIHSELPLRHPIEAHTEIGALLKLILGTERSHTSGREGIIRGRKRSKKP